MERKMSWTPTPSHLIKQMSRKRGPRHKGLENTKWNDEISYPGSEKLMSFWAIFPGASFCFSHMWKSIARGGTSKIIPIKLKTLKNTRKNVNYIKLLTNKMPMLKSKISPPSSIQVDFSAVAFGRV